MTESESALIAALTVIGRLPGAEVQAGADGTWVASGRPLDSLNHVLRLERQGTDAMIEARIDRIDAALRQQGSVPSTWWIGPSTAPPDLARRLSARGFTDAEPEYGMVIDVAGVASPGGDVELVEDAAGLDAFLGVMAAAHGWSDDRSAAWAELYRTPIAGPERPWWHVLVRRDDQPAACASLFATGEHAFVTNVGTIPAARGAGLGTTATLAVLEIAAGLGFRRASLTASVMGRGVYARIGFREDARLARSISPVIQLADPAPPGGPTFSRLPPSVDVRRSSDRR